MYETSFAAWPLVRVRVDPPADPADVTALFDALTAGLERGEPFALVLALRVPRPRGGARDALDQIRWIKRHRATIAARCAGIAVVADGPLLAAGARTLGAAERFLGCPARGFADDGPATAWARERIAALTLRSP